MIHAVKILPEHFAAVLAGKKTFEVRKADRPFHVRDMLALNEYVQEKGYTGRSCLVYIDYILKDEQYCKDGFVVMSIKPCVVHRVGRPRNEFKLVEDYTVPMASEEWEADGQS